MVPLHSLKLPAVGHVTKLYCALPPLCCCHPLTSGSRALISWRSYLPWTFSYHSTISLRRHYNNQIDVSLYILVSVFLTSSPPNIILKLNLATYSHRHILHLIITNSYNFNLISVSSMPTIDHHHLFIFPLSASNSNKSLTTQKPTPCHHLPL